uniref:Probable RNA-binding protein 18 n=1 Tax=Kalanchoe fedtschenkoi TaxID=63787 RepID=A0A7N0RC35_KALFE
MDLRVSSADADERTQNRLYIGNLDFRINESALIRMFSPYGKIVSEEFMWHNRGPKRGEPRGYAFVNYSTREEAKLAKEKMNGRLACGRPLIVRLASEKHPEETRGQKADIAKTSNFRPMISGASGPNSKSAKIIAIKNKLKDLEEENNHIKKAKHSEKD